MAHDFVEVSFKHVPTKANVVVYELAKLERLGDLLLFGRMVLDFILKFWLDDATFVCNEYSDFELSKKKFDTHNFTSIRPL
jgi:hypothetical protein